MALTVKQVKSLTESIKVHIQSDEYELIRKDEGLLFIFPVLGSDPEHVFTDLGIYQDGNNNVINLDHLMVKITFLNSLLEVKNV